MLIQAGAFWMGSDDGDPDERPLHRVFVRDFWLDRHKVTNREVALFLEARGLRSAEGMDYFDAADPDARIHRRDGRFTADPGFEDHPAEVSASHRRLSAPILISRAFWRGQRVVTHASLDVGPGGAGPPDRCAAESLGSRLRPARARSDAASSGVHIRRHRQRVRASARRAPLRSSPWGLLGRPAGRSTCRDRTASEHRRLPRAKATSVLNRP